MMNLPFIKKRRTPRQQEPMAEKSVGLSPDEQLQDQAIEELMDAVTNKDPKAFRESMAAIVMSNFENEDSDE